jgi:hypothetical protein
MFLLMLVSPRADGQRVQFDRDLLPQPVFHPYPGLVDFYWDAWQRVWARARESGNATTGGDGAFMALAYKYAPASLPAAAALDGAYAAEVEGAGAGRAGNPLPLEWVEEELFRFTADRARLRALLDDGRLSRRAFAGADAPAGDATVAGELVARQALSALSVSRLAGVIDRREVARAYQKRHRDLKAMMNKVYWDGTEGFYLDPAGDAAGSARARMISAYWAMLAEIPSAAQGRRMAAVAMDTSAFREEFPRVTAGGGFPGFAAGGVDEGHDDGRALAAYIAIKALERYGHLREAEELAYDLLLYRYAGFVNGDAPGEEDGLSALVPVALFIENVLGFHRVDANARVVEWRRARGGLYGIKNLSFGEVITDIVGDDHAIQVETNEPFTLIVNGKTHVVRRGSNTFR